MQNAYFPVAHLHYTHHGDYWIKNLKSNGLTARCERHWRYYGTVRVHVRVHMRESNPARAHVHNDIRARTQCISLRKACCCWELNLCVTTQQQQCAHRHGTGIEHMPRVHRAYVHCARARVWENSGGRRESNLRVGVGLLRAGRWCWCALQSQCWTLPKFAVPCRPMVVCITLYTHLYVNGVSSCSRELVIR